MLSRLLREFLFFLVHLVVNVLVAVQNVYHRYWVKNGSLRRGEVTKSDISILMEHVPRLSKRLQHLVVLADTEHHCMSDLARVVIWSLVAGVPFVSFHDVTGQLKQDEEKLFLEVERHKKGVPGYIKWARKPDLNGYTNGVQAHTVIINIFNSDDGRPKIAECISQIAEERASKQYCKEITVEELNTRLSSLYPSIPDPDVIFYTGPSCCSYGVLPWQIRLAEFVQLSLDHSLNINSYIGALYKYNKCDQRFDPNPRSSHYKVQYPGSFPSLPYDVATEIKVLMNHVPRLSKRLQHLVVLVDTERHCMSDLARLVIWSLVARVAYVSFHDITGKLKLDEERLFIEVDKHKKGLPSCIKWANKLAWNDLGEAQASTVVNIFSLDDGRPKIAEVIRRIAVERAQSAQNYEEKT